MQIMCVEYRAHVAKAVPGYGRYLGLGAFGERQPCHGSSSQVIEGDSDNGSFGRCLPPARAESIRCPGFAVRRRQYESALPSGCIQCDLERRTDRNNDPSAGLRLLKPELLSVIGRPLQAQ